MAHGNCDREKPAGLFWVAVSESLWRSATILSSIPWLTDPSVGWSRALPNQIHHSDRVRAAIACRLGVKWVFGLRESATRRGLMLCGAGWWQLIIEFWIRACVPGV